MNGSPCGLDWKRNYGKVKELKGIYRKKPTTVNTRGGQQNQTSKKSDFSINSVFTCLY